jgi:hypothetical protein
MFFLGLLVAGTRIFGMMGILDFGPDKMSDSLHDKRCYAAQLGRQEAPHVQKVLEELGDTSEAYFRTPEDRVTCLIRLLQDHGAIGGAALLTWKYKTKPQETLAFVTCLHKQWRTNMAQ